MSLRFIYLFIIFSDKIESIYLANPLLKHAQPSAPAYVLSRLRHLKGYILEINV
jgi:hypothetical protein